MTGPALSTDTDRRFLEIAVGEGLVEVEAVRAVERARIARSGQGQPVASLAEMVCQAGLLDHSIANTILGRVRAEGAAPRVESSGDHAARGARSFGAYDLEGELGRGGMGVVYRATHRPTGARRAVKVLTGIPDPELVERFRREAEALARIGGDGIVPVHETGLERGGLYFVMGLMSGGSLRARLAARGRIAWREAVATVVPLARALGRCHAAGLIHRDLKPDNVLFDDEGRPCLADFGCVRDVAASSLTGTGAILGTPAYMAPEQLYGSKVDARADIYSLGAMLHELVSGARPFPVATSIFQQLQDKLTLERPSVASSIPGVPAALDAILARALAPRAEDRYESMAALAADLDALLLAAPLAETRTAPRRGVVVASLTGIGAALALLGLALAWHQRESRSSAVPVATPGPRLTERPFPPAAGPRQPPVTAPIASAAPALPPLEIRLSPDVSGRREWKRRTTILACAYSPDGTHALSGGEDGTIALHDMTSGEEVWSRPFRVAGPPRPVVGVAFLSTARAVATNGESLGIWDTGGALPVGEPLGVRAEVGSLAVSADARFALVGCVDGSVGLYDLVAPRLLEQSAAPARSHGAPTVAISKDGAFGVTGNADGSVALWDLAVRPLSPRWTREGHKGGAPSVAFIDSPDKLGFVSGSPHDHFLGQWNLAGERVQWIDSTKAILAVAVRGDELLVAAARVTGLFDLGLKNLPIEIRCLSNHESFPGIAFAPSGPSALAWSEGMLHRFDLTEGCEIGDPLEHQSPVTALAVSDDGAYVVSGGRDGIILRHACDSGPLMQLGGPADSVDALAMTPDGALALSCDGRGGKPRFWVPKSGGLATPFAPLERAETMQAAIFLPDGRAVTGDRAGRLSIWHAETTTVRETKFRERLIPSGVCSMAALPRENKVLAGHEDGSVRLWGTDDLTDVRLGDEVMDGKVRSLAVARSGSLAVAVSEKGAVKVWELSRRQEISEFRITVDAAAAPVVWPLAILPDERRAVVATRDGALRVFDLSTGVLVQRNDDLALAGDYATSLVPVPGGLLAGTARGVTCRFTVTAPAPGPTGGR